MSGRFDKWLMLAVGLVGGWVISTAPGWMHASRYESWWGIATAFGTVSTGAFAAWTAWRQYESNQQRQRHQSDVANAQVNSEMRMLIGPLRRLIFALKCRAKTEEGEAFEMRNCSISESTIKQLDLTVSRAVANQLVLIPDSKREALSHAINLGPMLVARVNNARGWEKQPNGGGIHAWVILETACEFGAALETYLESSSSGDFSIASYLKVAEKLGIGDLYAKFSST